MGECILSGHGGGDVPFVVGSYFGDGSSTRILALGFEPKMVIVYTRRLFCSSGYQYGGIATPGVPAATIGNNPDVVVSVVSNGFKVYYAASRIYSNEPGEWYSYIAFK